LVNADQSAHYHVIVNYHVAAREWKDDIIFLRKIVPGRSDRSYGIQVARLAGLPPMVVARAREILRGLERDELSRGGRPTLSGAPGDPDTRQLGLFVSPADQARGGLDREPSTRDDEIRPVDLLARGADRKEPLGYEQAKLSARILKPREIRGLPHYASMTTLDVGGSADYKTAHVPDAKWILRGWLESKLPNRLPAKHTPILLTCPDGRQSVFAAGALAAIGYINVSVLSGGVQAWRAAGYGTENGMTVSWSDVNDVVLSPSITGDREAMRRYLDWEVNLPR
jgi:rhodanese-related sulfurtransferase